MNQLFGELIAARVFAKLRSMRVAAAALLGCLSASAIADPAPHPMAWIEKGREFYSPMQVRMWGPSTYEDAEPWNAVYIRINVSDPYPCAPPATSSCTSLQPGVWYHVDVRPLGIGYEPGTSTWIGADYMEVAGIEIITNGSTSETVTPNIRITFARPDDTTADCTKYLGQAIAPIMTGGNGVRSNVKTLIPMTDGQYKLCFQIDTTGNYPTHPAYGVNLTAQTWGVRKPVTQ